MMKKILPKYILYLIRWQLSTPILAACVWFLTRSIGALWTTIIANFIGGLIFFWVDMWIFTRTNIVFSGELWEVINDGACADCGDKGRVYRLVKAGKYDRMKDRKPEFRCHDHSRLKYASDVEMGKI